MMQTDTQKGKLLILGAGQYGQVIAEIAALTGEYATIDFLDDKSALAIGKLDDYPRFSSTHTHALVSIGNPEIRGKYLTKLQNAGFQIPVLIHPQAYVSASAVLKAGTVVEAMSAVNTRAEIGCGTFLCLGSTVNHDAVVGDFCTLQCGSVVCSNAELPNNTVLDYNSVKKKND